MIRDMVRAKPISWLLFILGSDILTAYIINILHNRAFDVARDYWTILKLVSMDLISFVFIMLFLDWIHVKFLAGQSENWFDKTTRIGGNILAAYFGWFSMLFIVSQLIYRLFDHRNGFQSPQLYSVIIIAGLLALLHYILRQWIPWSFKLNPF